MSSRLNRITVAGSLAAAGAAVLLLPMLLPFGNAPVGNAPVGAISSNLVGVAMFMTAAGIAYGNLDLWSALALGGGAWTLIAPVAFGFFDGGEAFWTHMAGGLAWILAGLAGPRVLAQQTRESAKG
jgi:hypothetical protein